MGFSTEIIKKLKDIKFCAAEADYKTQGYHIEVLLNKDQVRDFAQIMLEKEFYLDFVTAVHIKSGFQAVYQFGHFEESCHINAKAITEDGTIQTICDIFHGANWHEREAHDFYGLKFTDHPDLRVLLLDEDDADLNPLLKNDKKLQSLEGITRIEKSENKIAVKAKKKLPKPEAKKKDNPAESN